MAGWKTGSPMKLTSTPQLSLPLRLEGERQNLEGETTDHE